MEQYLGHTVYIRTVNYARVGTVVHVTPREIMLHPCADVIETGSFQRFFSGDVQKFARIPTTADLPACVFRAACTTLDPWPHELPEGTGD